MERLTKRDFSRITYNERRSIMCSSYCDNCSQGAGNCKTVKNMIKKLATYEDLEEQGLLVRLPCKVGDTVYVPNRVLVSEFKITAIFCDILGTFFIGCFTVAYTKEQLDSANVISEKQYSSPAKKPRRSWRR